MRHTYTLVSTSAGMSEAVCRTLRETDGVVDAFVIAGDFDIMVELEGDDSHAVLSTVTKRIRPLEGVGTTRTYVCLE
ncbi:Lrp/AsnC ligand binding domain-containing protein [Natronolimnobius baerhuensis]|uniref:AsnC family transcriptional regulator n=1 Tax=Natronolimnobius baerhuensis TaxID=253108 RepID=A0A202E5Y8_9EURY|nr:Lrp/AsnC ligand binding domain-containing protein [Natronolimnobius baerhuensis]OVE83330.1 AsnC family transcriptional regulator [Natronolimnobius baerhuensis]